MKFPWKIVFEYIRDKLTVYIRKSAQYQKSDEQWEQKTNEQIHVRNSRGETVSNNISWYSLFR